MFSFEFIKPKEPIGGAKLTAHRSGKLGLSKNAMEVLDVSKNKFCKFAINKNKENLNELYLFLLQEQDEYSYSISKAGEYYYIKAKGILNEMGIDYTDDTKTFIFDLKEIDYNGEVIYKLNKRIIEKT